MAVNIRRRRTPSADVQMMPVYGEGRRNEKHPGMVVLADQT